MGCCICSKCCACCRRRRPTCLLDEILRSYPIVVFSDTKCLKSYHAKRILDEIGADYAVVELNLCDNGWHLGRELYQMTRIPTLPQIFINSVFVGGLTDMSRYSETGELRRMVNAAWPHHDRNEVILLPNCQRPSPPRCLQIPRKRTSSKIMPPKESVCFPYDPRPRSRRLVRMINK